MPPSQPPQVRKHSLEFLKSFLGIVRIVQLVFGAGLWVTIAAKKYEGAVHFVLFSAVLLWLLTLASFFITLLDKQDLVPLLGGDRWSLSNFVHDILATVLYLPVIGIMVHKTERYAYCNLPQYKHPCFYKDYLAATVLACLAAGAYLLSAVHGGCRRCRGGPQHPVV